MSDYWFQTNNGKWQKNAGKVLLPAVADGYSSLKTDILYDYVYYIVTCCLSFLYSSTDLNIVNIKIVI